MSTGETLARARRDAGLSIADISNRTRIKLSVIDGIEHDDYSGCGGDYRARGTIAAIARAVGVDAGPLIEAYDAARQPVGWIAARSSEPTLAAQAPEELTPRADPTPVTATEDTEDTEDTEPITMSQASEPVPASEPASPLITGPLITGEPPHPVTPDPVTPDPVTPDLVTPAWTAIPAEASGPTRLAFAGQRPLIWITLGAALVAAAVLGGILLITGTGGQPTRPAIAAGRHHIGSRATQPAQTRPPPGSRQRTPPASPAGSRRVRALVPASIAAFGPGGAGQGDSPQLASQALAGEPAAPWRSAWYTTSHFGNLQPGTGLLLDMGHAVTITSARIALGNHPGADLALRIGNTPTLASLPPVARANGAAGVVELKTRPTRGRYVLVWFTRLPPDQAGTYQVSVYDIKLRGYA